MADTILSQASPAPADAPLTAAEQETFDAVLAILHLPLTGDDLAMMAEADRLMAAQAPPALSAFALEGHPWDFLHEVTDSVRAITALAGGAPLSELNDAERLGYWSLLDRLTWLQAELVEAIRVEPFSAPA
jgi:hypothetical protein